MIQEHLTLTVQYISVGNCSWVPSGFIRVRRARATTLIKPDRTQDPSFYNLNITIN